MKKYKLANRDIEVSSVCVVRYSINKCNDCIFTGKVCEEVANKYDVEYPYEASYLINQLEAKRLQGNKQKTYLKAKEKTNGSIKQIKQEESH